MSPDKPNQSLIHEKAILDGRQQSSTTSEIIVIGIASGLLLVAIGIFFFLDYAVGASLNLSFLIVYCAMWILIFIFLTYQWSLRRKLVVVLLFIVSVVPMQFIDWNSRKPFLRDLNRIRIGMLATEVDSIMGKYLQGTGWPACPLSATCPGELQIASAVVYRHTNAGWGNSDWGIVSYENGRVVSVNFNPD